MSWSGNMKRDLALMEGSSLYSFIMDTVNQMVDNDPMVKKAKCERDLSLFTNQSQYKYRTKSHMRLAI